MGGGISCPFWREHDEATADTGEALAGGKVAAEYVHPAAGYCTDLPGSVDAFAARK